MLKLILASIGVLITCFAAIPYIRNTLAGKTKPHVVTWLIWTVLVTIATVIQIIGGAKFGSLILATTAVSNLIILIVVLTNSRTTVTAFDIFILCLAIIGLVLWRLASSPELANFLFTTAMILGYIPTYKKSFIAPQTETISLFIWSAIKQLLGIAALSAYNRLTLLFPVALLLANIGLITTIIVRRYN